MTTTSRLDPAQLDRLAINTVRFLSVDAIQKANKARWVLERLPELGISIDNVTRQLEDEGVEKFNQPFDRLMETLAQRSPRQTKAIQA